MNHFTERQRFTSPWLWAALLAPALLLTYGVWRRFVVLELRTRVSSDGIHVRFFPLHLKERCWRFDEMDLIEAREYSPLKEYGGWGIRLGPGGTDYNVRGRMGIQLVLRSGRRVLIGTQDPEGFLDAVEGVVHQAPQGSRRRR